jgi:hypothetical protein
MEITAPDHRTITPDGMGELRDAWVAVTGPVILGKVSLIADLIRRIWSSAWATESVEAGLAAFRLLIYGADSSGILLFCVARC